MRGCSRPSSASPRWSFPSARPPRCGARSGPRSVDLLHIYDQVDIMASPFDLERVNALLESLRERAGAQLRADGVPPERHRFAYALDMRHKGQIHEVEVGLDTMPVGEDELDLLPARFTSLYERLYGSGSSLAGARPRDRDREVPGVGRDAEAVVRPRRRAVRGGPGGRAPRPAFGLLAAGSRGRRPSGTAARSAAHRRDSPDESTPPSTMGIDSCRGTGSKVRPLSSSTTRRWCCTRGRRFGWTGMETSSCSREPEPAPAGGASVH